MDLWILGICLFIVSTLMGGINYITTILNMRTKGMAMNRLPLSTWGLLFTAIMGLLSFPVLLAAFVLLTFRPACGDELLSIGYFSDRDRQGAAIRGRERDPVSASVLVPRPSGSLYRDFPGLRNGFGDHFGELQEADLRVYGDGSIDVCDPDLVILSCGRIICSLRG